MFEPKNKVASFNNTRRYLRGFKKRRKNWVHYQLYSPRGLKTVKLYNLFRMENNSNSLKPEQLTELAQTYRPESNKPELNVKQFLTNDTVQEYANKDLMAKYEELGWTVKTIAEKKIEIYKKSFQENQLNVSLKTVESIENNINPVVKVKQTQKRQISNDLGKISQTIAAEKQNREQIGNEKAENNGN